MAIVINGNVIDIGNNPISNASQIDGVVINENGESAATLIEANCTALKDIDWAGLDSFEP